MNSLRQLLFDSIFLLLFLEILFYLEDLKYRRGFYQVFNHIFLITLYLLISIITQVITLYELPFFNHQFNFLKTLKQKFYSIFF